MFTQVPVAQWLACWTSNSKVVGSSPTRDAFFSFSGSGGAGVGDLPPLEFAVSGTSGTRGTRPSSSSKKMIVYEEVRGSRLVSE